MVAVDPLDFATIHSSSMDGPVFRYIKRTPYPRPPPGASGVEARVSVSHFLVARVGDNWVPGFCVWFPWVHFGFLFGVHLVFHVVSILFSSLGFDLASMCFPCKTTQKAIRTPKTTSTSFDVQCKN